MPSAPPPPAQVDPGQSSLDFIRGMADPELQEKLISAERTYRPQYNQLELADIDTLLRGGGGQRGLLQQQEFAAREMQRYGSDLNTAQRTADVEDVERLGGRASQAFLAANPDLARSLTEAEGLRGGGMSVDNDIRRLVSQGVPQAQAAQIAQSQLGGGLQQAALGQLGGTGAEAQLGQLAMGQFQRGAGEMQLGQAGMGQLQQAGAGEQQLTQSGMDFLSRGGNLSPTQLRNVVQQSRVASQARGRLGDQSGIANETAARLAEEMNLERQNVGLGSQLLSQGFGMGQQRLGTGAQLLGQEFGMGQQRVGRGAELLGQQFGMGQQRLGTASNIYGQDLGAAQANAAMQQQTALANQQAAMSGRGMDLQGLLGLGQLQQSQQQGNRAYAMNLVNARQATSSDPFAAILGRTSGAPGQGMAATQFTAGLAGQQLGPNLFDPNAGINLALQNQANQSNYQSNIFGAQAGMYGAQQQARGAMIGGALSGLGGAIGCWVAREVYGNDNPMWLLFRQWLMEDSPDTFRNLYIKYGERFAKFISNKPLVKTIIRNWMTSKVKQKFFANSN